MIKNETVTYECEGTECHGQLFQKEDQDGKSPAVIVAHAWKGLDTFAKEKAKALAQLGFVGFAADLYGEGQTASTNEEAYALMTPLFLDRSLLRKRIVAAYETIRTHPAVDADRIGGIGYCFGGMTIIELFRSGAKIRGAVSFHGTLGRALEDKQAELTPIANGVTGSLLVIHGHEDPMVSAEDVTYFENECTEAKVDWQLHIYGNAKHAFTNPEADYPELGLIYNETASNRAWSTMRNFFDEVFT